MAVDISSVLSATRLPQSTWSKWMKDLANDPDNSDYSKFDGFSLPKSFYDEVISKQNLNGFVFFGTDENGAPVLIFTSAKRAGKARKKYKINGIEYYLKKQGSDVLEKIDKKQSKVYRDKWKAGSTKRGIKNNGFFISIAQFFEFFETEEIDKMFIYFGKDDNPVYYESEETKDNYKIKPILTGNEINTKEDGTIDGDPGMALDVCLPCPPFCGDDDEPGPG